MGTNTLIWGKDITDGGVVYRDEVWVLCVGWEEVVKKEWGLSLDNY